MNKVVILAAGLGTRLRPLTQNTPKPLIKINNKPIIESIIDFFDVPMIDEIIIVIGYLQEQFEYIKDKYDRVALVENKDFLDSNNISSLYYALPKIVECNAFVVEADILITSKSKLKILPTHSGYLIDNSDTRINDWGFLVNENRICNIVKSSNLDYKMLGISFFLSKELKTVSEFITSEYESGSTNIYWDEVVNKYSELLNLRIFRYDDIEVKEIDTLGDFEEASRGKYDKK